MRYNQRRRKIWSAPIHIEGKFALVPLTKGAFALVDASDARRVNEYKWHLTSDGYAYSEGAGQSMHRFLMNLGQGERGGGVVVDHDNGFRCDNRRLNLIVRTHAENIADAAKQKRTAHDLPLGVRKNGKRFAAHSSAAGYLGTFDRVETASRAVRISTCLEQIKHPQIRWKTSDDASVTPDNIDYWRDRLHSLGWPPER